MRGSNQFSTGCVALLHYSYSSRNEFTKHILEMIAIDVKVESLSDITFKMLI